MRSPAGVLETWLSCQGLAGRATLFRAHTHTCLRTLSGNLRWLHCGPPHRAGVPHEDSHPVSHTRLSRRVTGPQLRPLTRSLSPRPRPAITLSLFS